MTTIVDREIRTPTVIEEAEEVVRRSRDGAGYFWGLLRLSMGWIFFWGFIDKLFGLGFSTTAENAWIAGGSPTFGFSNFALKGPFAEFYGGLAGNVIIEWMSLGEHEVTRFIFMSRDFLESMHLACVSLWTGLQNETPGRTPIDGGTSMHYR